MRLAVFMDHRENRKSCGDSDCKFTLFAAFADPQSMVVSVVAVISMTMSVGVVIVSIFGSLHGIDLEDLSAFQTHQGAMVSDGVPHNSVLIFGFS